MGVKVDPIGVIVGEGVYVNEARSVGVGEFVSTDPVVVLVGVGVCVVGARIGVGEFVDVTVFVSVVGVRVGSVVEVDARVFTFWVDSTVKVMLPSAWI